mmetsp:Transcript_2322/g.5831  ORF Transcript_2322/g.5831 Transcript_2322/m.5831 type:complete len:571 (+) Transcript_2322:122-1834(+)
MLVQSGLVEGARVRIPKQRHIKLQLSTRGSATPDADWPAASVPASGGTDSAAAVPVSQAIWPRSHPRAPEGAAITSQAPSCSCVDASNVVCHGEKSFLIEEAVRAVCPLKQGIRSIRQALLCTDLRVRQEVDARAVRKVPRSTDEALDDTEACKGELIRKRDIPPPPNSMSQKQKAAYYVSHTQKQKLGVHLLPAVMAAHAVLPLLWATGEGDMFYDHHNMWIKRGSHDPFTNSTKAFLPEVGPKASAKPWGRCAVMGNSGILNHNNQGAEISAHDTIIRINQAPFLPKYSDAVGNRTDVRLLNHKLTEMYSGDYSDLVYRDPNATYVATRAETKHFETLGEKMQQSHPHNKLLFSTRGVIRHGVALMTSFRAGFEEATGLVFQGGNSPSSGLVAIQMARQMCTSVNVYGFALGNCAGKCPRYHYWNIADAPERSSGGSYKGHQYDVEGWLLKALHVMGVVCISPPPKKMPACGSRLGGLLAEDGTLYDTGMLQRLEELFYSPNFLDIILMSIVRDRARQAGAGPARTWQRSSGVSSSSRRPRSGMQPGSRWPGSGRLTGLRRRSLRTML